MDTFFQDLRFGFRMLAKRPGFTFVAVFVLALGIGANTAIFSIFNAILLRPLPYSEPDRLVMIFGARPQAEVFRGWTSPLNFLELRAQTRSFEGFAPMQEATGTMLGANEPKALAGWAVSRELFPLLGTVPFLGRGFTPEEDRPGGPNSIILSHELWRSHFGADRGAIGKAVTLDGAPATVVGVMPAGFGFPSESDFWRPLQLNPEEHDRGSHFLSLVGRLRPDAKLESAQSELNLAAERLAQQFPESNRDRGWAVVPLQEHMVGEVRPALMVLLGAVALVLLIACGNIANLLLARWLSRSSEIALRSVLGAGRLRMLRQLLTESLLLAILAGIVGTLLGYWGSRLLVGIAPEGLPRLNEVSLDARVLLFTLLATCLTVVLFGLVPTFQGSRLDLTQSLKGGGRGAAGGGRQRGLARSLLVIAELMLTVVLMIGAGLLMRSFMLLVRVDPGFDSERVLTMDVLLPMWKYERPQTLDFYSRLLERLEAMPGVESAAAVMARPVLSTNSWGTNLTIEGRATTDQELKAAMNPITPDYFSALRIPLRKGRAFTAGDDMNAPGVVIVSEDLAWRYFPGEDPIGKVITHDIDFGPDVPRSRTIVGVVGDVKQAGLASDEEPQMYVPHRQVPFPHMSLVVRTKVDPLSLVPEVRSTVWSIDREVPLEKVGTMSDILGDSVGRPGFYTALLSAFAAAGLIMAAVGLYGVLAYAVSQRTHELGIRMALGARPGDISSLVVRQGMSLALIGLVLGLVASLALSRWLKGLLYEIQPTDVTAYGLALLVVIGVVLLACLIPARRATRVDPAVAIRYE